MKVLAEISIVPLGVGLSLSPYVAACEKVLQEAGLKPALHAFGTNVEGEWETVFSALRRCHEVVHQMGAPRVSASVRISTRVDKPQSLDEKIHSVKAKLGP